MSGNSVKLGYFQKLRLINRDAKLSVVSWMTTAFALGVNEVVFNLYLLEAGFAEDFIGFFLSVSVFIIAALAVPAGVVTDRVSRKQVLLVATLIEFVAVLLQYSTFTVSILLLSQVILGIAWAFTGVAWTPYTASITTENERVHLFTIRFSLQVLGSLGGYLVGGVLPYWFLNPGIAGDLLTAYRYTLWVALVPLIVSVLAIARMARDERVVSSKIGFRYIRNHAFIGKYAAAWATSGLGAGLFVSFFNVFFSKAFELDSAAIGFIFALNTVVIATANFISPAIVDRYGQFKTIVWLQSLSVPFLAILSWSPFLYLTVTAYITRNMLMNVAWPVYDVFYVTRLEKAEQSAAMGVINMGDSVARGVGLNIGGSLLAANLLRAPFGLAVSFYALSVAMFYFFFRSRETKPVTGPNGLVASESKESDGPTEER